MGDPSPYASPASDRTSELDANAERLRSQYLSHENSIRSTSALFFLIGPLLACVSLLSLLGTGVRPSLAGVCAPAALGVLATGFGLRTLKPWGRDAASLLFAFGLLVIPIGTTIGLYGLYQLRSQKGTFVFSDDYRHAMRATPHLDRKTSPAVIALIIFALGGVMFAILTYYLATAP